MEKFSKEKTEIRKPPTYLYYLAGIVLLFFLGFGVYYFGYYRYFVKPLGGLTNQVENVKQKIAGLKKETNENRVISKQKIFIDVPKEDEVIGNPVVINGQAEVFEARFNIRIKDANGKILGEAMAMTQEGQTMSPYTVNLSYATSTTEFGLIEAFDYSQKDGSVQDLTSVKIKFAFKFIPQ